MDNTEDTRCTVTVDGAPVADPLQQSPPPENENRSVVATAVDAVPVPDGAATATAVPVSTATNQESPAIALPEIATAIPAATAESTIETSVAASSVTTDGADIATVAAQVVADDDIEAPSLPETRAEFLSATLYKANPEARLGITIAPDVLGDIRITALSEHGSVQHSPLRVGDKLLSINGKNCVDMDNGVAGELLRSLAGTITIIVHNEGGSPHMVETMVEKSTPSTSVGIGVHQTYRGSLNVSKVQASGLFAHSLVNVGDRVIAVNQVNCRRMEARTVIQMIRDAPQYVTLLTETQSTAGVVLAAASDRDLREAALLNEDARIHQQHFCYCLWMIIISLLVIGAIVLRPFS